jgi:hypothetical protein
MLVEGVFIASAKALFSFCVAVMAYIAKASAGYYPWISDLKSLLAALRGASSILAATDTDPSTRLYGL